MLGVNESTVRSYVKELGMEISMRKSGSVGIRMFTPDDVFRLAAHKHAGEPKRKPVTVSVYLAKGGVAKTTLATEMAVQFQLAGLKTLLVDLDPQASATYVLGLDPEVDRSDYKQLGYREEDVVEHTFVDLFDFPTPPQTHVPLAKVLKKPYGEFGPHLIPADIKLSHLATYLSFDRSKPMAWILQLIAKGRTGAIRDVDLGGYDVIMFDCAPASSIVTSNALVASDYCIAPVRLDALAAKSLAFVSADLQALADAGHPFPQIITVPTFFSQSTQRSVQIMAGLLQHYSSSLLGPQLRQSEVFPRVLLTVKPHERMPLSLRQPGHAVVSDDLRPIASELIRRFWPSGRDS
jgi:chromosome partitioning protein